ncbi:MAG: type II toxin-antitoxin system VapC family toxin [Chloroflexota bacterium]|nr:type II toxin-antitoxin system VapC family toxin [Chloroflexota bacterium]
MIVIDSNIFIAASLPNEPLNSEARAALSKWEAQDTQLIAPRLFRSELTTVVRKSVYQKRIDHHTGKVLLGVMIKSDVQLFEDRRLLLRAYDIAEKFNLPRTYDSQYLALAERYECEFWTTDRRLFNAISARFETIRWLGDFTP